MTFKTILGSVSLLFSTLLLSQDFKQKLEQEVCKCFEKNETNFNASNDINTFDECFDYPFEKYKTEIIEAASKEIDTTSDNAYELGRSYGKKLFYDIQENLILSCDSYYKAMQDSKNLLHKNLNKGTSRQNIDSLSNLIQKSPKDDNLLWERGANYLSFKDYNLAEQDFLKCLELSPKNEVANFFLGITYDLQDKYKLAINYYEKILKSDRNIGAIKDMANIYYLIAKRKLIEQTKSK